MITIASGGVYPSNSGPCFPNMAGRGCDNAQIEDELMDCRFVPNAADVAVKKVVESYHIDTQAGLCPFADTIRAHRLHEGDDEE